MADRIQKVLAHAGYGSRRELERAIAEGRVKINERVAVLGDTLGSSDRVRLDGRLLNLEKKGDVPTRVLAYKKHVDQVVTRHDPEGRPTVFRKLPKLPAGRWLSVGRLDVNTSGLLLLTTDGELKRRLEHPSYQIVRTYAVRVRGEVDQAMLDRLVEGVQLEDGIARFESIREGDDAERANRWFEVTVRQGRNRVVRRLWDSQGVTVSRLMRTGFGPVPLPTGVKAGSYRELSKKEVSALARLVDLKR
ncbi:pseudouridine synthase [Salinisphaera hydrothermalis]|uniref:Pseudouridine synthase n=1 Tax=Salinisphaera hydrothermalis (strain C41B8) TaxID=1304275 RepID=A0A084IG42_SALHC|nr:pseudouridine synthase [Salinisphaera hydrothermalis]KEZ75676.1 ribosomal large subunit pseudouridine synthase B [Salinisphaera hydrothermalis C41B8]